MEFSLGRQLRSLVPKAPTKREPYDAPREIAPVGATPGNMYIDGQAYRELWGALLRTPSRNRVALSGFFHLAWGAFAKWADLGLRLDDKLCPEYRDQEVEAPVFIFANPRSGTTLLHRLMSYDAEHFAAPTLSENIFQSVCWLRGIEKVAELDEKKLGGVLHRLYRKFDDKVFRSTWSEVHQLGLGEPEEDELCFLFPLLSPTTMLLLPQVDELRSQLWFDELPPSIRGHMMDYYEGVIKRLLFVKRGNRRYLNKNVHFIPRVRTVHERFPDARFIYLARHPYDVMPSFLNMYYAAWKFHSPEIGKISKETRALAEVGYDYYRYAMLCRELLPKDRFKVVRYDDLVASPRATVEGIYEWLEVRMSDSFRAKLIEVTEKQREYEATSSHRLEEFGLTKEEVYEALERVFRELGFEP